MKYKFLIYSFFLFFSELSFGQSTDIKLNELMDNWHLSAAKADYQNYFKVTTENFVFLGTAPGERWNKEEFQTFSKPYFEHKKTWDFKPSNRKWDFSKDGKMAWFDEDLDTWMKGCRGSGICIFENDEWKIAYYNLTVLIENEKIQEFIQLREK